MLKNLEFSFFPKLQKLFALFRTFLGLSSGFHTDVRFCDNDVKAFLCPPRVLVKTRYQCKM